MAKYICKNNPAHTFTEPTADFWCPLCEKNTGMLELVDEATTPIEDDGKIDALEEEIELLKKEISVLNESLKNDGSKAEENLIQQNPKVESENDKNFNHSNKVGFSSTSPKSRNILIYSITGAVLLIFIVVISILLKGNSSATQNGKSLNEKSLLKDVNNHSYRIIRIGNQTWMAENLNVDKFRNGDEIPEAKTNKEWQLSGENGQPAWCYYDNDPDNGIKYGKLYNWYAVNDPRGLAPEGWHISTESDWEILIDYLGGEKVGFEKMKSKIGWDQNGNNASFLTILPAGVKLAGSLTGEDQKFYGERILSVFHTSNTGIVKNENGSYIGVIDTVSGKPISPIIFSFGHDGIIKSAISRKELGASIRCLKN